MKRWLAMMGIFAAGLFVLILPVLHSAAQAGSSAGRTVSADRGYWAMVNGRLEKWDFHHDGTFLHEGIVSGVGADVGNDQRGTYRIEGNKLVLHVGGRATAFSTGVSGSHSTLGGGAGVASQTLTMTIRLIGPDGADGIVLNGTKFGIRHGW
jgi:hypothetical protein